MILKEARRVWEAEGELSQQLWRTNFKLEQALLWIKHLAMVHYLGAAFDPEHMRTLANMAADALGGKEFPDYEQAMEAARVEAKKWAALFADPDEPA